MPTRTQLPGRRCPRPRTASAGFTLVELMVAMTGGLFLSLAVMALSRDFSKFSQQSIRVSNATLASANGFERLSGDLARAGHLASPNITSDPRVCNRPTAAWPAGLQQMRAIVLGTNPSELANTELEDVDPAPMSITIAGALDMTEELTATVISSLNGVTSVGIRVTTPAASRIGLKEGDNALNTTLLQAIFVPGGVGRAIRIAQNDGLEQYAVVAAVQQNPLRLVLAPNPAVSFRTNANAAQCGVLGLCTGCGINVVNFVRYRLRPLLTGSVDYQQLRTASQAAGLPYEAGRVELVRDELTPDGVTVINGTEELVAEYATDLQFVVSQLEPGLTLSNPVAATINNTYPSTHLLRGVRARFSTRSREADRTADVAGASAGQYRIRLPLGAGSNPVPYARVRSLQADISLRNLEGSNW
ncbi:MAG TPA: prepilin-type N-terminal cleavage/methylation domain-containing protein [Polyangiaceae bacterium]